MAANEDDDVGVVGGLAVGGAARAVALASGRALGVLQALVPAFAEKTLGANFLPVLRHCMLS